jgi:hypothetical protein
LGNRCSGQFSIISGHSYWCYVSADGPNDAWGTVGAQRARAPKGEPPRARITKKQI